MFKAWFCEIKLDVTRRVFGTDNDMLACSNLFWCTRVNALVEADANRTYLDFGH